MNNQPQVANRRTTQPITNYSNYGKLPPSAVDLEEIILGAIILKYNSISVKVWGMLRAEFFYNTNHELIFKEILNLRSERKAVDIAMVTNSLRKSGNLEMVGGAYALTELLERVASSANIEHHILIIHQMFLKRELIRIGSDCIAGMYDDTKDPLEQIRTIVTQVKDLEKGIFKRSEKNSKQLSDEVIEDMLKPRPEGMLGISTGLKGLDFVLRGDQEGSLRAVAADTSVGKTIELCTEVLNSCFDDKKELLKDQIPTAIFSLEMPSKQVTYRLLSNLSSIENTKIKTNQLDFYEKERFDEFLKKFNDAQIYIDDTPGLNILEFETKAALMVALYGIKRVYIDYFQLMKGEPGKKYGTRENELADISRRLKTCAKELYITIVVYSQLGPEVHKRPLSIPMLADLRECKAFGFDADIVMFIWRPDYYEQILKELNEKQTKIFCKLFDVSIEEFENICFFIVAKNRDGELGKIPFRFNGKIMRIYDHYLILDAIERLKTNQIELTPESRPVNF